MATDRFFMMPHWFFDDGHLTAMGVNTFTVYMILVRHSNSKTHECNPSYSSIQKKAKIGRTAISSAINYLVKYGYIEIVKTGNATQSSSIYKVLSFSQIKGINQSHIGLVLNETSPKKRVQPVLDRTATSPNQDCELVLDRTQNIQTINIQIEKDKKEKDAETFFSDSLNQNQAMQQEENSADSANKQDPTPLTPAPLSDAAIALKAKFEAKFDRKANKYEPQGLTSAGYGEWHLGELKDGSKLDSYNNWKKSLIITAQNRKRLLHQPETVAAAAQYIRNTFDRCKGKDYWADFESLIVEAIAYEQALASNPTLKQEDNAPQSPQTSTQVIPEVGELSANGARLVIDCRWSHFYPRSGRLAKKADGETQVFWDIESRHPPEPISDRLSKFFAEKLGNDLEKIKALLEAKHYAHESLKGYDYQVQMFVDQKSELVTAFNQEIEKLLHLQAA